MQKYYAIIEDGSREDIDDTDRWRIHMVTIHGIADDYEYAKILVRKVFSRKVEELAEEQEENGGITVATICEDLQWGYRICVSDIGEPEYEIYFKEFNANELKEES